jgi:2-polyprenyl-3-methyl-5-hydroxy-6-metoxy-1,4-benzoquinol methylase
MPGDDDILRNQVAYYRQRAPEYDQYYERTGPFDLGSSGNLEWADQLSEVETWVRSSVGGGAVLDVAAGTGWWTSILATLSGDVTALDAAPEMLAINRERTANQPVTYVENDIFDYRPERRFDTIFFGFWLSHVPAARFAAFWERVADWLAPDGEVIFVDNMDSSAPWVQERPAGAPESELMVRKLNDGRQFTIVKTHWTPAGLASHLASLGWRTELRSTSRYFVFGNVRPGR